VTRDGYLLDNAVPAAGARFDAIAELFDASTFRHIDALGIAPGWRCWEVGAGGASVVRGLAARVGPTGHVLATDIDVSWTGAAAANNVTIARHDVAADRPPDGPFDLVHARLVLVHVAERDRALRAMTGALRPGGWLVIEDADPALQPLAILDVRGPDDALTTACATRSAPLAERGADPPCMAGAAAPADAGLRSDRRRRYFPIPSGVRAARAQDDRGVRAGLIAAGAPPPPRSINTSAISTPAGSTSRRADDLGVGRKPA
jgi:SAM-dependent methyltransferase